MNEVADTVAVDDPEPEPEPEVVVVDDELLLLQAATNSPLATIMVASARLRVSLTLFPLQSGYAMRSSDPALLIQNRRYSTMNGL